MDGAGLPKYGYRLGPKMPIFDRDTVDNVVSRTTKDKPHRVLGRTAAAECSKDSNLCEKPYGNVDLGVPVGVSLGVAALLLAIVLFILHKRHQRKLRREDAADAHKSLDFGLSADPNKKRKSAMFGSEKEGLGGRRRQLSMDINLSSPYLLPPEVQDSRESLHSLTRTLHQNEDPYRHIQNHPGSEVGSLRSFRKDARDGASTYTGSSGHDSRVHVAGFKSPGLPPPRQQNFRPQEPNMPAEPKPVHLEHLNHPADLPTPPPSSAKDQFVPMEPESAVIENMSSYPDEQVHAASVDVPVVRSPEPSAQRMPRNGLNPGPQIDAFPPTPDTMATPSGEDELFLFDHNKGIPTPSSGTGFNIPGVHMGTALEDTNGPHMTKMHDETTYHEYPRHDSSVLPAPMSTPFIQEPQDYYENYEAQDDDGRGRAVHRRQSSEYAEAPPQAGLGVPQHDNRRLSVGLRPLPSADLLDTEDPETRANRIRSFYKEYFDEGGNRQTRAPEYYEDYDSGYLGETAFFDPDANAFVMPYAQPVARRAMTPPPSGSRVPGGRGPRPRPHPGSMSSMRGPNVRGPPRPGSSVSNTMGPRPGSSASTQYGRPRAGSAFSARPPFGKPKKPMPPPAALTTLPTPSKLRDDSFALMGAVEFAPPPTFKDQAAGRPQSPLGERRPYQLNVPVASPLVSSFDEMAALPSPHLLRKSGTFTGLDFAPPKKFKDPENMSDAGSIRSNRSGMSMASRNAVRAGAGRVSRLPGDTVFTQAALSQQLKPSWDLRQ